MTSGPLAGAGAWRAYPPDPRVRFAVIATGGGLVLAVRCGACGSESGWPVIPGTCTGPHGATAGPGCCPACGLAARPARSRSVLEFLRGMAD